MATEVHQLPKKICPFCKEEIKEGAIKCKHCKSMLIEINPQTIEQKKEDRYTKFILDKDLIRFTKWALSFLGIFIVVGLSLYGWDLKNSVKDLNEANQNLNSSNDKINVNLRKTDSLQAVVDSFKNKLNTAETQSSVALEQIQNNRDSVIKTNDSLSTIVNGIQQKVLEANNKSQNAMRQITTTQKQVTDIQTKVQESVATVDRAVKYINVKKDSAQILYASIQTLTIPQQNKLEEVKKQSPEKFRTVKNSRLIKDNFWAAGTIIKIAFLDGTEAQKDFIKSVSAEWALYANLIFKFVDNLDSSDARISFKGGSRYYGTDCLALPKNQSTLGLSYIVGSGPIFNKNDKAGALRAFGTLLGLPWENANPACEEIWNMQAVNEAYSKTTQSKADFNNGFFGDSDPFGKEYFKPCDPQSIMIMNSVNRKFLNGIDHDLINTDLSEEDKKFIASIYPK